MAHTQHTQYTHTNNDTHKVSKMVVGNKVVPIPENTLDGWMDGRKDGHGYQMDTPLPLTRLSLSFSSWRILVCQTNQGEKGHA